MSSDTQIDGVIHILTTPFDGTGEFDESSLCRLIDHAVESGVSGLTVLGVAGEANRLTPTETDRVLGVIFEHTAERVPIYVGVSRPATIPAVRAAQDAEQRGAQGVMVAPPTFLGAGPQLTRHLQAIDEAIDVPIVLQDFPPATGVTLSPRDIGELAAAVPGIRAIKMEGVPTGLRTMATKQLLPPGVTIVGGIGGMYLLDELQAGSVGTMTGYAFPEALVKIVSAWAAGRVVDASATFFAHAPLMALDGLPGSGLSVRKWVLRQRGLIDDPYVREPATPLPEAYQANLAQLLKLLPFEA